MKLVTVATQSKAYFPWLSLSCKQFEVPLNILGWGEKWQGFNWRNKLMLDYLDGLKEDEVVCFIDAYDVILMRDFADFERLFWEVSKKVNCEFIVSVEIIKSLRAKVGSYYFGKCNGDNLNAGCYVGTARKIKEVLANIWGKNSDANADDQVLLSRYCRLHPSDVYIDKSGLFFKTIVKPFCNLIPGKDVTSDDLEGRGCFILHANFFTRLDEVLVFLGYPYDDNDKRTISIYILQEALRKWWWLYLVESIFYGFVVFFSVRWLLRRMR